MLGGRPSDWARPMQLQWPTPLKVTLAAAGVALFAAAGHFCALKLIEGQQADQLSELADTALRRTEAAVEFGAATLDEIVRRKAATCDPASLQMIRLQIYGRSAVKDVRIVNHDASIVCSAFSETLEFDKEWVGRSDMLASVDGKLLLFRVDQIGGVAVGVAKDVDPQHAAVAIVSINADTFDIAPAELRDHSEVLAELGGGLDIGRFATKAGTASLDVVAFTSASRRYPLKTTVRVERRALERWHREAYWPMMLVAALLGLAFGILAGRTLRRVEGPIAEIDDGLARGEFRPFFQPTFDLRTGAIVGCEVLARWVKGDGTIVSPASFIPLAESSNRIEAITWQILAAALKDLRSQLRSDKLFKVSVNISPRHLMSDGFVDQLRQTVRAAEVSARQIVVEVTEREPLSDLEQAAAIVHELRDHGFRVAMDDVGVGHSGLSQIKKLGVDTLKIDKVFVDGIAEEKSAMFIVEMLVRLAASLEMSVIAEGIEHPEQIERLIACGVTHGQGYIVAPPLPFARFAALVEANKERAAAPQAAELVA